MLYCASVLLMLFSLCESSNILIVSTVASHSHSLWCNKLAELLVQRGHKVTILDTDLPRKKLENLTTFTLEGAYEYTEILDYDALSLEESPKFAIDKLLQYCKETCFKMIESPTFKRFLAEYSTISYPFDLMIHDVGSCDNFLGLAHRLGIPKLIGATAFGDPTNAVHLMRNQQNMIHSPLHLSPYSHPMNFFEKLENFFITIYTYYSYNTYIAEMDTSSKSVFGRSTPNIWDIGKSMSLVLFNSHPILDGAKYYSPAIIPIPGFIIDEPKELDKDTKAFLDGAVDGAIYFSLGSNILSANMTTAKKNIFLNTFKKLKQRILWKFEDDSISDLPSNVRIAKWYRQKDVLAHPNIKLFITHSGLLRVHEAVYHGVPMICLPIFIDQQFWAKKLAKKRVAVPLVYANLTEEKLQEAIDLLLTSENHRTEIKKLSSVFKDRPQHPQETAIYWIEYVLRHDDLEYLQPPEAYTSPFQLFVLDVKTISGIVIGFLLAMWYLNGKRKVSNRKRYKFKKN